MNRGRGNRESNIRKSKVLNMVGGIKQSALSGFDCLPRLPMRRGEVMEEQPQQQQTIERQSMTDDYIRVLTDYMKQSALSGFDCAPRLPMRRGEATEEQQQQQQSTDPQSVINNSMRVLMDSMKQIGYEPQAY
jgi:hypothetical protein